MVRFKIRDNRRRLLGTPRLKCRFQLLVLGIIFFMIYVSFKILQPELFALTNNIDVQPPPDEQPHIQPPALAEDVMNHKNMALDEVHMNNKDSQQLGLSVQKVIKQMVEEYKVDMNYSLDYGQSPWDIAAQWVTAKELIPEYAPELGSVLNSMTSAKITAVGFGHGGTQLKLSMKLDGNQIVAFKPKRYERDYIVHGVPWAGLDRHNGEIVAFHLSRLIGFRRTPLAVGRVVSISKDIVPVASKLLLDTFYQSEGNTCFYGKCLYCNKDNGVCAEGDSLEGTVILWLPPSISLSITRHPWSRTYRERILAKWETDETYCNIIRTMPQYQNNSHLLMDIIDTAVFDFMIGNADRHHYETVQSEENGMLVMLDNAKSFGDPFQDVRSVLAPLYQCCSIRSTTWQRLQLLQKSVVSGVLREVLKADPIYPVVTEDHLQAMDRRLELVLQEVKKCISTYGLKTVILDDR